MALNLIPGNNSDTIHTIQRFLIPDSENQIPESDRRDRQPNFVLSSSNCNKFSDPLTSPQEEHSQSTDTAGCITSHTHSTMYITTNT